MSGFGAWRSALRGRVGKVGREGDYTVLYCADYFKDVGEMALFWGDEKLRLKRASDLINSFLTLGGWHWGRRDLAQGRTIVGYRALVAWDVTVKALVGEAAREGGQWVYIDGRGYVVLADSYEADIDDLAVADFTDGRKYLEADRQVELVRAVLGRVEVRYLTATRVGFGEWWTLTGAMGIEANSAIEFIAEARAYYGVFDVRDPVALDYTANSRRDGSGVDKAGSLMVTVTTDEFSGQGCVVNVNNRDSDTVYLTALVLKADSLFEEQSPVIALEGGVGMGLVLEVVARFIDYFEAAAELADDLLVRHRAGAEVQISLPLLTPNNLALAGRAEVGDRFVIPGVMDGLDGRFLVRRLRILWEGGEGVEATYWLDARAGSG